MECYHPYVQAKVTKASAVLICYWISVMVIGSLNNYNPIKALFQKV